MDATCSDDFREALKRCFTLGTRVLRLVLKSGTRFGGWHLDLFEDVATRLEVTCFLGWEKCNAKRPGGCPNKFGMFDFLKRCSTFGN